MWQRLVGLLFALLTAGCMQSKFENLPPECGNEKLAYATGGYLGRSDGPACMAEIQT